MTIDRDRARDILDHSVIGQRYFFCRAPQPTGLTDWPVIVGQADNELRLECKTFAERGPAAVTVVHFHGNGEIAADHEEFARVLAHHSRARIVFGEYRGYAGSDDWPALASMLDDAREVVARVAATWPDEPLVVMGRSVGSIYAIAALSRPEVAAVILESGIADVEERIRLRATPQDLGCTDEDLHAACATLVDHSAVLRKFTGPSLILHTRHDGIVDCSHAERMAAWHGAERAQLHIFEQGNHNSILYENSDRYLTLVIEFLAQVARADGR